MAARLAGWQVSDNSLSVQFWDASDASEPGTCVASWYGEEGAQVPRMGETVWMETDEVKLSKWRVVDVQWSFKYKRPDKTGLGGTRYGKVEVWIKKERK